MDSSFGAELEKTLVARLFIFALLAFAGGIGATFLVMWIVRHLHIIWR